MSVTDVTNAFKRAAADGRITQAEAKQVLAAPGNINPEEEKALVSGTKQYENSFDVDAKQLMSKSLNEIKADRIQTANINRRVEAVKASLSEDVKNRLNVSKKTLTFGGSAIPEDVKKVMNAEYQRGAIAYDVREMNPNPVFDTTHGEGEITIEGKYNPYSQEQPAVDSMAFDHTELTPAKIKQDMSTVQTFNVLESYSGSGDVQRATFKQATMKGSGSISSSYDEAHWTDTLARSRSGDKYASNFAILADGSVHAVPFSRRTRGDPGRILTTASLARGKQMVFNGHIEMKSGVITYVGMSGRLGKLKEDGTKFVDPIAILKAWGFQLASGLTVTQE